MVAKWKKDRSIALVDVLDTYQIYKGEHGMDGMHASKTELANSFGTDDMDEMIEQILQKGEKIKI